MATLYVIPNWERDFENSKSRQVERTTFFCFPNDFASLRFRRLLKASNACEVFGIYLALCAVASRCIYRGVLMDQDGPLTVADLADITGFSSSVFVNSMNVLCKPPVDLLQKHEIERDGDGDWPLPSEVRRWAVHSQARRRYTQRTRSSEELDMDLNAGSSNRLDNRPLFNGQRH